MKKFQLFVSLIVMMGLLLPTALVGAQDEEADRPLVGFWEECATPENLPDSVTIGGIFSLSGPISRFGLPQGQAVELAVGEINESGYLGEGVTLEVITEDAAGDADQAINAMTKLIEEDGVVAVLGPTLSTQAFAADPVAQENEVPVLGVSNTASGITDMGEFVFRDSLPESAVIPGTVAQAVELLGIETVGVMFADDDDFTVSGFEVFVEALEDNDVEILGQETFATGDVDFSAQLTNLLAQEPDALAVSALGAEAVQIITQARELGFEGPIMGGNGFNSPTVPAEAGADSDGVVVGAAWNIAAVEIDPISAAFAEAYEDQFDNAPDQFAAQAYTGAWLMATAIRCADSTDSVEIRDALAAIRDFPSPLGSFSFDEDRNPVHDPVAQLVQDGEFTILGTDE